MLENDAFPTQLFSVIDANGELTTSPDDLKRVMAAHFEGVFAVPPAAPRPLEPAPPPCLFAKPGVDPAWYDGLMSAVAEDELMAMLENTLASSYTQKTFSFTGVPDTAVGTGLCIVLKFSVNTPSCYVQYQSTGATSGNNKLVSTTSSDAGWTAGTGKSMLFEVWGTYKTQGAPQTQYFLTDIRCAVRTGTSALGRVEKSVRVLNEPQVAGP